MTREARPAAPVRRADPRRARTRARLLAACEAIVREGGVGALTTVELARRAGVHQPALYAHFEDLDALLVASAVEVTTRVRLLSEAFYRTVIFERVSVEVLAAALDRLYEVALAERRYAELYIQNRLDRSPLGREMREVTVESRKHVRSRFEQLVTEMKIDADLVPPLDLLAAQSVATVLAGLELLVEHEHFDRTAIAANVARQIKAVTDPAFEGAAELSARRRGG